MSDTKSFFTPALARRAKSGLARITPSRPHNIDVATARALGGATREGAGDLGYDMPARPQHPQSPPPPLSQHTFNTHKQPATPAEAFFATDKFRVSHFKVQPEPTICLFFVCGRDAPQRASSPACRACPQRNTHNTLTIPHTLHKTTKNKDHALHALRRARLVRVPVRAPARARRAPRPRRLHLQPRDVRGDEEGVLLLWWWCCLCWCVVVRGCACTPTLRRAHKQTNNKPPQKKTNNNN